MTFTWDQVQSLPDGAAMDGRWFEPNASGRDDLHPKTIRRDCWVVQHIDSGAYLSAEGQWVHEPAKAWSCLWLGHTIRYLTMRFGDECCSLRLRLMSFYCSTRDFPHGWFADE